MPFKAKLSGIYKIQRIGSMDCYIGQALNIYSRWSVHRHLLRKQHHHSNYLQNAFQKYGENAFSFEIVELFSHPIDRELLTAAEQRWIDLLRPCYNMNPLAQSQMGFSPSLETRAKQRAAKLGRPLTAAHRKALSLAHKGLKPKHSNVGRRHSEETKKKISEALSGRLGRLHSTETKAKMSASRIGKIGTMRGKKHSAAARMKMRDAHLLRYAKMKSCNQIHP